MEVNRAHQIYLNACRYAIAARLLNQNIQNNMYLLLPSVVNAALALELYFKSLFYLENGEDFKVNGRHSHDFSCIFTKLSDAVKRELESDFDQMMRNRNMDDVTRLEKAPSSLIIPRDLKDNLSAWSDVFVNIRYIYDSQGKKISMMFFDEIEHSVLAAIHKRKPEWINTIWQGTL